MLHFLAPCTASSQFREPALVFLQSIQELKGVTSSELCDYIQLTHEDAVAAQPTEPPPNRDGNGRCAC